MALAQEINRIIGLSGNLPAFDGRGGLADTGAPATAPSFTQLTVNGPAGNGTNVTTAAIPATITPFYPQSISFTVANTNGPYDGQTFSLYWTTGVNNYLPGGVIVGWYLGYSNDGQFSVQATPGPVGTLWIGMNDQATGWSWTGMVVPPYPTSKPTLNWTPTDGLSGNVVDFVDENGNPQSFDAGAWGGTGVAIPIFVDPAGNIHGVESITLSSVDTTQLNTYWMTPGALFWDNSGGANSGHWWGWNGSVLVQIA
jgi:hypothetical protein